ncbi:MULTISPECIES: 50S ribosomal protein L5 [unclassified Lentimonas]|uniref:50S ribosomal protein L5 n=1 Tax=unclassified Lentimonas TaxID=2630993 RepID=UPI00132C975D|nr:MULTISPECIES: 50S ribosomal protein L5 [unclassified Lentimonas]CAA6677478.1 LSU ribosomal protein L5p (L11e) [Lentimonas sp. CC4]CAA6686448.1 LSU ribosomal protein L5p (L11e) [Lentimonas sp. CC6]CAA6690254.1 LSU ribosomal protein L5p (L11e) [Lentimonas sp. CC19]CAA6690820.1 LSU ribosomal protein L5p (L11e) [Lentimonas sp. CC10]CAA7068517.1 LSU ribosomal protein L5p (L11e) [Lentimonas sp. CC11]
MQTPALKKHYTETVIPALMKKFGYANPHQVPSVKKIVLNSGFSATDDKNHILYVNQEIGKIAGQRPVTTKAKLSISNFKLREGQPIGVKVTLRGRAMYEFLNRLIQVALPCIRDFRGVPAKLDGQGNYTLGVSDHSIFPEVSSDGTTATIGMDICINTSASNDEEGRELLALFGMPFRKSTSEVEAEEAAAAAQA